MSLFFFFNDTATTEIYTLSLHDALPISRCTSASTSWPQTSTRKCRSGSAAQSPTRKARWRGSRWRPCRRRGSCRSEEHTSELQSQSNLVCRLLLEKKKKTYNVIHSTHIR